IPRNRGSLLGLQRAALTHPSELQTRQTDMRLALALLLSLTTSQAVHARELTPEEKRVISSSLIKHFSHPLSARFIWTPWPDSVAADAAVMYCGQVDAKGANGSYEGYHPYLATVLVRSGRIVDAVLIGTNFPSPKRAGSPMRQCIGKS